jgi:hypothetical protein
VLIGLGDSDVRPTVEVHWPDGEIEQWDEVEIDRWTDLLEGTGGPRRPES